MAYGDSYTYVDENGNTVTYTVAPSPAQDDAFVEEGRGQDHLRIDDANRARAAGVTGVDKIDYAAALHNYETRPDAETLAHRRARENAVAFADQDFARWSVTVAEPGDATVGAGTTRDQDGDGTADNRDSSNNPFVE